MGLQRCEAGHYYHGSIWKSCPFCFDTIDDMYFPEQQGNAIAECPDPEKTMVFIAHHDVSYWLQPEGETFRLIRRYKIGSAGKILENRITLSESDAMMAIDQILEQMSGAVGTKVAAFPQDDAGDCRILINTEQLRCDYRWKQNSLEDYSCYESMQKMIRCFPEAFPKSRFRYIYRRCRENRIVDLDANNIRCRIWWDAGLFRMELEHFDIWNEIILPLDAVREISTVLSNCRLFVNSKRFTEADIDTTDMPIRDDEDVVCHYPVNSLEKLVVDYLVECFIWYRENS